MSSPLPKEVRGGHPASCLDWCGATAKHGLVGARSLDIVVSRGPTDTDKVVLIGHLLVHFAQLCHLTEAAPGKSQDRKFGCAGSSQLSRYVSGIHFGSRCLAIFFTGLWQCLRRPETRVCGRDPLQ